MKNLPIKNIALLCLLLFLGVGTAMAQLPSWQEMKKSKEAERNQIIERENAKIESEDAIIAQEDENRNMNSNIFRAGLLNRMNETLDSMKVDAAQRLQQSKERREGILHQQKERVRELSQKTKEGANQSLEERKKEANEAWEEAQKRAQAEKAKKDKKKKGSKKEKEEQQDETKKRPASKPKTTKQDMDDLFSQLDDNDSSKSKKTGQKGHSMSFTPNTENLNLGIKHSDDLKYVKPGSGASELMPIMPGSGQNTSVTPDTRKQDKPSSNRTASQNTPNRISNVTPAKTTRIPSKSNANVTRKNNRSNNANKNSFSKPSNPEWHPPMALPGQGKTQQHIENPALSNDDNSSSFQDYLHLGLDVCGLAPVVGEACDGVNGVWYLIEGNKVDAALSFSSAIPVGGYAATTAKMARRATKYAKKGDKYGNLEVKAGLAHGKNPFSKSAKNGKYLGKDKKWYPNDFQTTKTNEIYSKDMKLKSDTKDMKFINLGSVSEGRKFIADKMGKNPVDFGDHKFRSQDGVWQYRAKPDDVKDGHIHLEKLNPQTGEVIENYHFGLEYMIKLK